MKKIGLKESVKEQLEEDYHKIEEMSAFYKKYTKLPVNIWVDDAGYTRNNKHHCFRIKIQNNSADNIQPDTFEIYYKDGEYIVDNHTTQKISDKDKNKIIAYLEKYKNLFDDHWELKIDTDELKDKLREQGAYQDNIYKKFYKNKK